MITSYAPRFFMENSAGTSSIKFHERGCRFVSVGCFQVKKSLAGRQPSFPNASSAKKKATV
jgi:hypothetical protein